MDCSDDDVLIKLLESALSYYGIFYFAVKYFSAIAFEILLSLKLIFILYALVTSLSFTDHLMDWTTVFIPVAVYIINAIISCFISCVYYAAKYTYLFLCRIFHAQVAKYRIVKPIFEALILMALVTPLVTIIYFVT